MKSILTILFLCLIVVVIILIIISQGVGSRSRPASRVNKKSSISQIMSDTIKSIDTNLEKRIIQFLHTADTALYEYKFKNSINKFSKLCTQEYMAEVIRLSDITRRTIELPRHYRVEFTIINVSNHNLTVRKDIKFIKETLMGNSSLKLGRDRSEYWVIETQDMLISNIYGEVM